MRRYNNTAVAKFDTEQNGNALSFATVTVRDSVTGSPATIYSDNGSTQKSNPLNADADGNYFFYVKNGRYNITINEGQESAYVIEDESIFDESTTDSIDKNYRLELIAHRGFRDSFPQNTMLAFTSAIRAGADSLECDVQISADGVPFVFHDTTVDALTNGTGTFTSLSSSYIESLKLTQTQGTFLDEVPIPRLSEVLLYCTRAGINIYPEIKGYRTAADISIIVGLINSYGMQDRTVLQSFVYSDLEAVRSYSNTIAIGYLGSSTNTTEYQGYIEGLSVLGNAWLLWNYNSLIAVPAIKSYADGFNVKVGSWTVNDGFSARQLMEQGIRHIMSDVQLEVV